MRAADAPAAGWYPDPEHRTRLRWWDGLDWTEARRPAPSEFELERYQEIVGSGLPSAPIEELRAAAGTASRMDSQQIITEVRNAARAEVDRAAQEFTNRAESAVRSVTPLIDTYATRFTRTVKWAAIAAILLAIAWFTFQTIAQASFFEWIGDRIDNLFDDEQNGLGVTDALRAMGMT